MQSAEGVVNIYELGTNKYWWGEVSLVDGCTSKVLITTGSDAFDSKELNINKQSIIEGESFAYGFDYEYSYENEARSDRQVAISIACESKDITLIKEYITGVSENELVCVELPNCDDVSEYANSSDAITTILDEIKNANMSGTESIDITWPENSGDAIIGCEVKLYNDINFRVAITKETNLNKINCPMESVTYSSYNRPGSNWEILKSFLNAWGASFELGEFSGSERLRVFEFYDPDNSNYDLRIVVEERYSNLLGYYLFGENWDTDFIEDDRKWVLYIYSPSLSDKFEAVKEDTESNLLEQRRLTYYALTNQFPDDGVAQQVSSSSSFLNTYNYAAQLKCNTSAETQGVTVYTFDYGDSGIEMYDEPIQYDSNLEFDKEDVYYPVDINLWDGDNDKPSLGESYYSNYDFLGKFVDGSIAITVPTGSGGVISGYLKGFGYCEFVYIGKGGTYNYSLGATGSISLVDGKYLGSGVPTPLSFCGPGTSRSFSSSDYGSPISFTYAEWAGYDDGNYKIWEGISAGVGISIQFMESSFPIGVSDIKVQTELCFPSLEKTSDSTIDALNSSYYEK